MLSDRTPTSYSSLLANAGLQWVMPRMQRPRRLRLVLTTDAMDCLTTQVRHHDFSSLVELQCYSSSLTPEPIRMEQGAKGARVLQGILKQVSALT